ncbi:MAG: bifunctional metallophosphatase/5'-nucleotidase [Candidatus Thorarchaeota archaeon]
MQIPVTAQAGQIQITIAYTHDIHGHMLPDWTPAGCSGGMPLLSTKVDELRALRSVLLLDCGDILSGGAINDLNDGLPMIEVMNAIGYDAMSLDNHEFDLGIPVLQSMMNAADFDILSANVDWPSPPKVAPYSIETIDGYEIGVIGLTPSFWYAPDDVTFGDLATSANTAASELASQGVNFVIVLGCVSSSLANSLTGVDLIVKASGPEYINGILVVPSVSSYAFGIGALDLTIDTTAGTILEYSFAAHSIDSSLEPDDDITAIINGWDEPVANELDRPFGYFDAEQFRSDMGVHLAEAILDYTEADIATYNLGGVRDNVDIGFITLRDLYHVEPFFNHISTLDLPGNVIQSIMGSNYFATDISSFEPSTIYTVGSANFSISSFERSYPGDATNRHDDVSQSVVSTLADYLDIEYSITDTEVLIVMSSVFNAINGLSDSALGRGDPSNLRTTMTEMLSEADSAINQENEALALYNVEYVAEMVATHVTSSCAKRWLSTNLYGIVVSLGGPGTPTAATSISSTMPTFTPPNGGNPIESIFASPWTIVVILEIAAIVIILVFGKYASRSE